MLATMGKTFGEKLVQAREAAGLSGYRLVQLSGIAQGNLQAIERGRRPPSDANLEALAEVAELGVTLEQLLTWRDLDRLGPEGIERIRKYAPEVLMPPEAAPSTGRPAPSKKGDDVIPQIPGVSRGMSAPRPTPEADLDLVLANATGLTDEERQVVAEAKALGMKSRTIGTPDYLAQPVEKRRKTIEMWKARIKEAREKQGTQQNG